MRLGYIALNDWDRSWRLRDVGLEDSQWSEEESYQTETSAKKKRSSKKKRKKRNNMDDIRTQQEHRDGTVLDLSDLLKVETRSDNLESFDAKRDETITVVRKYPDEEILESLYLR